MNPVTTPPTNDELLLENEELRRRLEEAEDALRALRAGEADAVFVDSDSEQVYTLEKPENSYRLLVAQLPNAAVTLNIDGAIIACNRRFAELLGRPDSLVRNRPIRDLIAPDSHAAIEALIRDGRTIEVRETITFLRGDGTPISLWLGVSALHEGALGLCLMVKDLTEQRHFEELSLAQEALRASEERYRTLFKSIDEGFCVIQVLFDESGRPNDYLFLETNPAFDHQTGLRETVGKSVRQLLPAHEEYWYETYGRVAVTGEPIRFQNRADALQRWYDVYAFRVGEPSERKVAVLFNDITERKRTDEALRRSECELADFFDNAVLALHWVGPDGIILRVNQAELDMLGYTRDEYVGRHIAEFHADRELIDDILRRLSAGEAVQGVEARLRCKDGSLKDVIIDSSGMWEDGRFIHTRCFTRDVTDQKQAEKARRSQQRQLQLVSDSVPALISYVDDQYRYRFCNRAYSQWFGLPHDEIVGRTMCEVLGAEAWASFRPHIEAALAGRSEDFELEAHYARGGTRWIHAVYSPDRDPDGSVRGVIVLVTDITAYKRQEHQVAEQARLLNQTNDAIIVRDPQNRIIYWNRGAEELYGYSTAEALGRVKYDLLRTEFPQSLDAIIEELHREGRWTGELVHTRKDGDRLNVLARWVLDHDADGRPGAILETTNDITARKRAEVRERELTERMYAATAKFESVFNQSGIFAGVMDLDGNLREVNDLALNACGYRREEVIDRPFWETPWWRGSEDVKARIRAGTDLAGSGTAFREVLPYWWADGTERVVDFAMNPIRDQAGAVRFLNPTGIDITDRVRAEQALRDGDRRKDEFLATLAHELRNPLAPVRNAVQILLAKGPPDPLLERSRNTIDRQVRIMARLLDDLLDVSRISRNKLELRRQRIALRSVIEDALEISTPLVEAGGHALAVTLPDEPVELDADAVRLAQVFANLLNNAAKYTDRGGKIALSAARVDGDVVVSVKDTGIGISAQALPRVFEIFSQAQSALERAQGGLGIGLSLVKGVVELHGGSVFAHSDGPGKGSEFIVRLPVASSASTETEGPDRTPSPAACEPADREVPVPHPHRGR